MTKQISNSRLIAIGDIHGHADALESLLQMINVQTNDTVVTLGDYVNRGPNSRRVLDLLIALEAYCHLVPILGNHDEMMLDSRNDVHARERWLSQGGDTTLASYGVNAKVDDIPQEHWDFLNNCMPYFETEEFIFTHANYCWYSTMDQQPVSLLRWLSLKESPPRPHLNGKTFIVGHTPGPIRDIGHCICLDTGCGFGGNLTAMELVTKSVWQVGEQPQKQVVPIPEGRKRISHLSSDANG